MSYATNQDVQQRMGPSLYVQLTDDAGTGVGNEALVTAVRQAAEGEVNGYLGRRYAVPVDAAGQVELQAVLRSVTLDLVEYRLHSRRPPVQVEVATRQKAALEWLQRAALGQVVLVGAAELPAESGAGHLARSSGSPRVWSRGDTEGL